MLTAFRKWLRSPDFSGNEETTTMADILNRMGLILLGVLILTAVIFVPFFSNRKLESWLLILFLIIVFLIGRYYLFKGKLETAAIITTLPAWLLFYGIATIGGGINSPLIPVILTSTVVITFVVDRRFKFTFLVISLLSAAALAYIQSSPNRPGQVFIFSPASSWFLFALALVFMHVFINTVITNLRNSLKNAHAENDARLKAEKALQLSEDRFKKFMQNFPGLVYIKNIHGQVVFANQGFDRYFDMNPETMPGKTNSELFGNEMGHRIDEDDRLVFESHMNQDFEEEFSGRFWSTQKFLITQDGHEPLLGGVTVDITARKLAEKKLQQSEEFFKQSQHAAKIGSYFLNFVTGIWDSSEVMDEILGLSPTMVHTYSTWIDVVHPDDREMMNSYYMNEVLGKHNPFNKEYRVIRQSDGAERWVLGLGQVLWDENGTPVSMTGTIQDITERRLTEDMLRESEARFGNLLQGISSIAVQGFSADGTIHLWNRASENLTGYSRAEAIGQNIMDLLIPPPVRGNFRACMENLLNTGQADPPVEFELVHRNGSHIPVISSLAATNSASQIPDLYFISIDLSEKKKAEKELAQTQELIKAIVDTTTGMVWSVDPVNFGLITWNPAYSEYFLKHRMLAVQAGMTPEDLYPADSGYVELWRDLYSKTLENGTFTTEYKVHSAPDIIQLNLNALKEGQSVFAISIFGEIITERKKAEDRIEQSEKKYRELFKGYKDGILIYFPPVNGDFSPFKEANDAAPGILGYSPQEILTLTPLDLEPTVTDEQLASRISLLESREAVEYQTILRCKSGQYINVEIFSQKVIYDGQPAYLNIIHDITDSRQREHELQAIAALSFALRTAHERSEMLPVIMKQIVNLVNCDSGTIEIIDHKTGDAVAETAYGKWEKLAGTRQKSGTGMNALIGATRQPFTTNNLEKDTRAFYHEWARYGIVGCVGVPLIAQEKLIGFIWVGRQSEISKNEVRLLTAVSDIAANAIYRSTLHEQTRKDAAELAEAYDTTLDGWARALELRENETAEHSKRVVKYTLELARQYGFHANDLTHIQRGASLHDIGKMGIPDSILLKKGPLSPAQWKIMKQHPVYALELLSHIPYLQPALVIPRYHHERWNGSGYPEGLKGEEIPLEARIFAVIDVWDALSADRPYRKGWPREEVLKYLRDESGRLFDPQVVSAFLKLLDKEE